MIDEISLARQRIAKLGVSISTLATVAGLSATELGQFLSGQRPCPAAKAHRINQATIQLENLVRTLEPIPIDMRQAVVLIEVLKQIEDGALTAVVTKQ